MLRSLSHRLLLLLLAILVASSHGGSSDDTTCLQHSGTCGSVQINYPFYLSHVTFGNISNESYCGYPGLAILCENEKPVLQLGVEGYSVTAIDYASRTVSLADPDVLKNEACPSVDRNTTVPSAFWLYLPPETIGYVVFLLGCSFTGTGLPERPPVDPITCQIDGGLAGLSSFVIPEDKVPAGELSQVCRKVIEAPVLKYGLESVSNNEWKTGGYGKVLRDGFQLAWNNTERPMACVKCEESDGRCGYSRTGGFVGCFCPNGRVNHDNCGDGYSKNRRRIVIVAITSSILLASLLLLAFVLCYKKYGSKRKSNEAAKIESFLQKNKTIHPKRYNYAQVKRMTKSFAEKLGQGGFGAVYRGNLSDGRQIAVKILKDYKTDGEDFINEVASISRTSHVNVVTLLGFCLQGSKRALIYDYMPNGSLERYAFKDNSKGDNILSWEKLFDIAVGIARGLEYLHRGCNTRIVHFDIKPHNILLDKDFCPKISDFGLAKLCLNKESAISIGGARGTIGYIAPEVYSKQFGAISSKSDVYSYGMMVLEMVGARDKKINASSEASSQYFPQWIYEHLDEYCVTASEINDEITETVRKMIVVGLWCIQLCAANRPTMTRVVEMLEGSTSSLELPPKVLLS